MGEKIGPERCEWIGEPELLALEQRRPVRPVRVVLLCQREACDGDYRPTGVSWPMSPPGHHHKCIKCGDVVAPTRGRVYPRIDWVED